MLMHASQNFFIMLEKLRKLRRALLYYPTTIKRRAALAGARWLLSGESTWTALEQLNVPGFGTDLIRIDFPPPLQSERRQESGCWLRAQLTAILKRDAEKQRRLLTKCLEASEDCLSWSEHCDERNPSLPWRVNPFLPLLDIAALYGILREEKPKRYVEIGSGISTRVAWQARQQSGSDMRILSIDPSPRVEVEDLCDEVFRSRLEEFPIDQLVAMSGPGTILFFDGSHRCFPSSDVTVFFLEVLPRLQPGTVVQIHDIYMPRDYSAKAAERFWSEQYMLEAYLLGGARNLEVVLPCYFLSLQEETRGEICRKLGAGNSEGYSFWMRVTGAGQTSP